MSEALIRHLYQFGDFTVDREQKVLLRNGTPQPLTPKAFDTLLMLVEHAGQIVEKEAQRRTFSGDGTSSRIGPISNDSSKADFC